MAQNSTFRNLRSWHLVPSLHGKQMGTVETVTDFIFLGSKITADGDYSHKIKRRLLLGRKAMTNLESILESRDIILPTKVCLVKAMVFPGVMYGCEIWTIKKQLIDMSLSKLWDLVMGREVHGVAKKSDRTKHLN